MPNHEPFLTLLAPCVLEYRDAEGQTRYAAADGGVLLMERRSTSIVTREAVVADRLEEVADAGGSDAGGPPRPEKEARDGIRRTAGFAGARTAARGEARMNAGKPSDDPFVAEVRRQAERASSSRRRAVLAAVASVGAVGWMVSLPAVVGA